MDNEPVLSTLDLPKGWTTKVKSAVLHLMGLARVVMDGAWIETLNDKDANPFQCKISRLEAEIQTLREVIRIKDQRILRIPAPLCSETNENTLPSTGQSQDRRNLVSSWFAFGRYDCRTNTQRETEWLRLPA